MGYVFMGWRGEIRRRLGRFFGVFLSKLDVFLSKVRGVVFLDTFNS